MAKLIDRQFTSKHKRKEFEDKLKKFTDHYKLPEHMGEMFYTEVRNKIRRGISDEETIFFKHYGLDK